MNKLIPVHIALATVAIWLPPYLVLYIAFIVYFRRQRAGFGGRRPWRSRLYMVELTRLHKDRMRFRITIGNGCLGQINCRDAYIERLRTLTCMARSWVFKGWQFRAALRDSRLTVTCPCHTALTHEFAQKEAIQRKAEKETIARTQAAKSWQWYYSRSCRSTLNTINHFADL